MSALVLDIEQHMLLLELEAPFDKRDVQLARRRMAKRWHPDIAPAGRRVEHERHLKAINLAADQLERVAEGSRGGRVSASAVRVSSQAARRARAEAGRRSYEAQERARTRAADKAKHDPFASRVPDHSVVHRYARCLSYPEWGVGTVAGIYFSEDPEGGSEVEQWARVRFSHGVRTVPAGSLSFVDFSKPDHAHERGERFMIAAQRAMAEGEFDLAAQRLVYARDAQPGNVAVLRLMTLAFWQSGNLEAAARAVRDWARADRSRPAAHRFAARIYEDMGAIDLAEEAAERAAIAGPEDAGAWARLASLRVRLADREGALSALRNAGVNGGGEELSALLAQALALRPHARERKRAKNGQASDPLAADGAPAAQAATNGSGPHSNGSAAQTASGLGEADSVGEGEPTSDVAPRRARSRRARRSSARR